MKQMRLSTPRSHNTASFSLSLSSSAANTAPAHSPPSSPTSTMSLLVNSTTSCFDSRASVTCVAAVFVHVAAAAVAAAALQRVSAYLSTSQQTCS